jgi:hypothetical protein
MKTKGWCAAVVAVMFAGPSLGGCSSCGESKAQPQAGAASEPSSAVPSSDVHALADGGRPHLSFRTSPRFVLLDGGSLVRPHAEPASSQRPQ